MSTRVALGVLALALVAGCGGKAAVGSHPSPEVSPSTNGATSAITTAFNHECAAFDTAYNTIRSATQGQTIVGQLIATLTGGVGNTANDWSKQLDAAATAGSGLPSGASKARALQLKIYSVAVALDKLQLYADLNKLGKIPGAWSGVLSAIDSVRSAGCS